VINECNIFCRQVGILKKTVFLEFEIRCPSFHFIFLYIISRPLQRYKRSWNEQAKNIVTKKLILQKQQDYVLKKVHRLLDPKCILNCSSNSSDINLSVLVESEKKNLQLNELIDLNDHSQSAEVQNDIAFERLSDDMSYDKGTDENENIYENENTDESGYNNENINKRENTDESENKNIDMIFENDEQKENYVILALQKWASSGGVVSMSKIDELLAKLRPVFNNLPKSYKSLLKTSNVHITQFENGGQFWYRGIRNYLDGLNLTDYLQIKEKIEIDINTDGLPLFRSSKKKFWPILGYLVGTRNEPFVIAIYFGNSDPNNVQEFLQDFINEVENLMTNGYIQNERIYDFVIRHYVLDASARELIKCCIGHNGYASCEKCTVWGERVDHRRILIYTLP